MKYWTCDYHNTNGKGKFNCPVCIFENLSSVVGLSVHSFKELCHSLSRTGASVEEYKKAAENMVKILNEKETWWQRVKRIILKQQS